HQHVRHADARDLPFADGQFRSVMSVSVLEHIRHPERVISELYRVLRPGGCFAGTIVLADLHAHLFYPHLLGGLGLSFLGRLYMGLQDRAFRHYTLLPEEEWHGLFASAGFEIVESRKIVSRRLAKWWDALLPLAVPYRFLSWLGYSAVWHPAWFR